MTQASDNLATLLQHKVHTSCCIACMLTLIHVASLYASLLLTQATVVRRLQQPSWGQSVPVENSGQAALLDLLQQADLQPQTAPNSLSSIEWALHYNEMPATWYELKAAGQHRTFEHTYARVRLVTETEMWAVSAIGLPCHSLLQRQQQRLACITTVSSLLAWSCMSLHHDWTTSHWCRHFLKA